MKATDRFDSLLQFYAEGRLDWKLLKRQMLAESGADPAAKSPVGAEGLFQFMPATALEEGLSNPLNPEESIKAGARYMAKLLKAFGDDYKKALAAYNWGRGNVSKAVSRLGGMWETALPTETRDYLKRILG